MTLHRSSKPALWLLAVALTILATSAMTAPAPAHAQAEPDAIPSVTLDSNQPGQLVITWQPPQQAPTDYRIRWTNTNLNWLSWKDTDEAQRANEYPLAGVTTITLNDLTPGDTYKVQMRSRYYNADRTARQKSGPWTATATQRVKNHPPAAPTSLTTSEVAHDSLILSWDNPNDANITGYRIQRGTDANSLHTIEANTGSPSTNYTDSTVETETTYHYAVLALSQDGNGARSITSVTTLAEPDETVQNDPPPAPTGLMAAQVGHSVLILTWNNPQDDTITGYRVLRGDEADNLSVINSDTGSNATEYEDSTVEPETTYHYAVLALSQDGNGARSITSVTTPAEPQPEPQPEPTQEPVVQIDPPAGLAESNVKHNSLTLTWDDPNNDTITGYRILKGTEPDNLAVTKDDTGSTNTKYTDSEVEKATTYFYSVNALTTNGSGPRSHLDVTTPAESINSVPSQTEQASLQTLVSSMDRTSHQMANLISKDMSQEFQTGSNPNDYKLHSIDLYLTGRSSDLTVELRTATGTLHATLTPTSGVSFGHAVYTFVPPANTMLTANTHYWIVVKGTSDGWFKAALSEDAAAVPGWKLADNYEFRPKYSYDEHGAQSINPGTKIFKVPGHMSVRINRQNNAATGVPTISGTPLTQQTLTASAEGIDDDDDDDGGIPNTFDYQWMRYSADGTTFEINIGTNSNEYTLVLEDEGKRIRVVTSFVDGKDNDEGPFLSDAYPSGNTITAPIIYTMVSSTGRTPDSNRPANISASPSSQSFTTSGETAGHILTSVTVVSMDAEEDEFAVKICEVRSNAPTTSCNDLTPPTSFTAGQLVFNSPSDRTITLSKATTYALVFSAAAGTTATLPTTDEDNEDPISLPGWSIRNRSQLFSNNQWMDRGYDVAYLIAIKGEPTQISQASGRPTISGNPAVGQTLTATADTITAPEGVVSKFSYQWRRLSSNGFTFETNVGANSNQYTLTSDDLDKKFQVEVKFVDTGGRVIGFPITSPTYPTGRTISTAPLISNTSQSGNSNVPISTEVAQSFTTGPSPHGYQPSRFTIFYDDEERRHVNVKICETSRGGSPTADCWNLKKPGSFVPGPLNFTVPDKDFHILNPNTTYAVVANGPRPRTVETTVETACPQTDPDFTESCIHEVMVTVIVAAHVGVTTSNGEDTSSSQGWSIRNAYQQNNEGTWRDISSEAAIRIAVHADIAPNKEATGVPAVIGTARVGQTLTATTDDIGDPNGLPSTFTYQWKRHSAAGVFEADIGANSSQYTLTSADVGKKINVEVSFTDLGNYDEGPLLSEAYPHGDVVIATIEDDLLVSNIGHPTQETVQATTKVGQVFATGTNPNGYEITSVTVSGNTAPVTICRFANNHSSSPSSSCQDNPSTDNPSHLLRNWLYAIVIDPNTVGVTEINEADQTSLPNWSIKGTYQVQNQQGEWNSSNSNRAIRVELRGKPASPFNRLGQLTATPADRQITLNWRTWTPNNNNVIQNIQYRVKQVDETWNPDWTDIRGSNDTTEAHTIRNLTNGVAHTIELRAVFDQDGQAVYSGSASINATPRGRQTAPSALVASTAGDGSVTLSWADPIDSTLTGYQYRHRNTSDNGWNPDWTTIRGSNADTTSHTLTRLRKNLRYTFEVRTIRDTNQGPAASSSVTPRGPMPRLQNLEATADDHQVSLSWSNPGDHGITSYQYRHKAATESQWNPNWTAIPRSNGNTTSYTVLNLTKLTSYTLAVRALRGLEEGPSSSTSATTPDGPAKVPDAPRDLSTRQEDQGFTVSWRSPADEDARAPVTSYRVRYRQIGTTSWQNTSVTSDDCCSATITGLRNRHHYEVQVSAVNRLGASTSIGPVNVTPQAPATEPPGPTGDADLNLGQIGQGWTTTGNNTLFNSCTGTKSFQIIWNGPEDHSRRAADQWAAHINTRGGAGVVSYSFARSPGQQEYYELNGTVDHQGTGNTTIHVRGRFGQTWGTWSRVTLYCF